MSYRKRKQMKFKQKIKRRLRRIKLIGQGKNLDDFFSGKYFIAQKKAST
ncbi:hypothetical protein ACFL38_02760 [Candidatus Omnitrophota bacterium]